ncbi:MAG: hypothetical protein HGA83_02440 [Bacteroidales bacterium]|nr:hypothetical protein [Bacteroidales bacterium]
MPAQTLSYLLLLDSVTKSDLMTPFISFFNQPFFTLFGGISTVFNILVFLSTGFLVLTGVLPVLWRLGKNLSKRKIAIYSDTKFDDLKAMLIDSGLFKENNIIRIEKTSIEKARDIALLLVHWSSCKSELDRILNIKNDQNALIVYAPPDEGRVDDRERDMINVRRNAIIVNFRGRLLNDVLTCMMTTGYKK